MTLKEEQWDRKNKYRCNLRKNIKKLLNPYIDSVLTSTLRRTAVDVMVTQCEGGVSATSLNHAQGKKLMGSNCPVS